MNTVKDGATTEDPKRLGAGVICDFSAEGLIPRAAASQGADPTSHTATKPDLRRASTSIHVAMRVLKPGNMRGWSGL